MSQPFPSISAIHHLKLPTRSISESLHFYTSLLPFAVLPELTHRDTSGNVYAEILRIDLPAGALHLELRHASPTEFPLRKPFNFITFEVESPQGLHEWRQRFLEAGQDVSKVLKGLKGDVLAVDDGQGNRIRFYCNQSEMRRPEDVDQDDKWLN